MHLPGSLLLAMVLVSGTDVAQLSQKQVSARADVIQNEAGTGRDAVLRITLAMESDVHVNSNAPRDPNLTATVFTALPVAGIKWGLTRYPSPKEVSEWYSNDPLPVYQDGGVIEIPFEREASTSDNLSIGGVLQVQACDHEKCYPVQRLSIRIGLNAQPTGTTSSAAAKLPTETEQADFELTDLDGKKFKLSDFHGKVVLLDFWATWCKPCLAEFPFLADLYLKHRGDGFEIIGLDCETLGDDSAPSGIVEAGTKQAKLIAARLGASWPMAETRSAVRVADKLFHIESLPTRILIDREGKVIRHVENAADLERAIEKLLR